MEHWLQGIWSNTRGKGKVTPLQARCGPEGGYRYSCTLFLDLGTRRGEWSASRPGRTLPPGKTRDPFYRRLGGPQSRSGQVRKILLPPGLDPRNVQPVASHYIDRATPAHI
jgi:hypothetical protein